MAIDYHNRCFGCMEEKTKDIKCPHCGWVEGSAPESALHLPPGTVLQEKYLIGKALGQGGFGITYLAYDLNLKIKLAVKEYLPQELAHRTGGQSEVSIYKKSLAENFNYGLEKFMEEARTLAFFNEHPNIVTVRDFFKANGTAYLVMNYIEGVTLKEYLESREEPLSFEQALNIFMPVLDALREVHAVGMLHRDISPDNLLIDARGQVFLIDFGTARQAMGEKSRSLSVIMKAGYSPEEQYRSKGKQGPWTDIYAVAAAFYHAVTGQLPVESLDRVIDDPLTLPSKLGAKIENHQENVLLKALAVKSRDRFQNLEDFQAALLGKIIVGQERVGEAVNREVGKPEEPLKDPELKKCPSCNKQIKYNKLICNHCKVDLPKDQQMKADEKSEIPPSATPKKKKKLLAVTAVIIISLLAVFYAGNWFFAGPADELTMDEDRASEDVSTMETDNTGALDDDQQVNGESAVIDSEERSEEEIILIPASKGNSIGNIINVGIAAYFDDRIFYRRDGGDVGIYSLDIESGEQFLVVQDDAWNINATDGWIYYSNRAENWNVYRVRFDGTERARINSDDSGNLQLAGDWLYYRNDDDGGKIYRMRTDGSDRSRIHDEEAYFLNVLGGWVFYQNRSDGGKIYKIRTDGTERTRINNDDSWNINVTDGWIYYTIPDVNWNIFKIRLDGTERTRINSDESGNINVAGEWIYYRNDDDNSYLYRIRTDGSERARLNNDQTYFHSIHGERIYYQNRGDDRRTYRIRLDGSDRKALY